MWQDSGPAAVGTVCLSEPGFLSPLPSHFPLLSPPHRLLPWPGLLTHYTAFAFALNRSFSMPKQNHECCPATKEQTVTQTECRQPMQDNASIETKLPPTWDGEGALPGLHQA